MYTKEKQLRDWISEGFTSVKLIDITPTVEGREVKHLFEVLWQRNLASKGRVASESGYKDAKVTKVQRIS